MGINVALTGLHASDNPAAGIGIIRSLRHPNPWDGEMIALAYDVYETGIHDPELPDHTYLIPYPNQGSAQVLERIKYIHSQIRIDVLIPTLDSELIMFQTLEPELEKLGIKMFIPSKECVQRRSKAKLPAFCEENDIPTPKTVVVNNPAHLNRALEKIGYPCYVKGVFYLAYKCNTHDEALKHFESLKSEWGLPILIQESVTGEEFDVCAVSNREGDMLGAIPIRKLRITGKGKAWAAITLRNPEMDKLSRKILKALKWSGPCEIEILQESKTKKLHLIEVNPRFPSWIFLGTGCNQNLPKLIVDLALGNNPEPLPAATSGISFVRHATDLICNLDYVEQLTINGELHHHNS